MPPAKRKRNSRAQHFDIYEDSESSGSDSPRAHKSARKVPDEDKENQKNVSNGAKGKQSSIPVELISLTPHRGCGGGFLAGKGRKPKTYEYICFHRPLFDVDGEHWQNWSNGKAEQLGRHEIFTQLYEPSHIEENKKEIWGASPTAHKNHKWVIMWSAWLRYDGFCRRAKYCDPDNFNMHLYKDWKGWGMQEIVDNAMVDFEKAYCGKGAERLDEMWAIISAIGLWVNVEDVSKIISGEDGKKTCELIDLVGCALLTVLDAIDQAGELTSTSRFPDLALVIGYYLELSHDLPAYGIEGSCVSWRKDAVRIFKKAKLDIKKGLFATGRRLRELEHAPNYERLGSDDETEDESDAEPVHQQRATGKGKDPWLWL